MEKKLKKKSIGGYEQLVRWRTETWRPGELESWRAGELESWS